jgi:hypothetical protein
MMCLPWGKTNGAGLSAASSLTGTEGSTDPGETVSVWLMDVATECTARRASVIEDMVM